MNEAKIGHAEGAEAEDGKTQKTVARRRCEVAVAWAMLLRLSRHLMAVCRRIQTPLRLLRADALADADTLVVAFEEGGLDKVATVKVTMGM